MAISTADAAKLRRSNHKIELVLNKFPLVPIATAQIDQQSFTYPINVITVDNTSPFWTSKPQRGMAFAIGTTPGATDVTWGVMKATPGTGSFSFDAKTLGDSGYATDIHTALADDQYVTVYAHRPMWGILSAIRNKIFYKHYDEVYINQGSQPDPLLKLGRHLQADADPITETAQLTLTAEMIPWGAATPSSYQWSCEGATAIGGETSVSVTYEFSPGAYIVNCAGTDSNGKIQYSYRYIFINHPTLYPAVTGWTDIQAPTDRNGLKMSITLYGDFSETDIYPGQFWMVNKRTLYNGETFTDTDKLVHTFCGYLSERSITRTISTPSVDLVIESPLIYAKRIGAVAQQIVEKTSPAKWTECSSALSNPPGATWYILHHHAPSIIAGHDFIFDPALKQLRKQSFVFQAGTIGAQLNFIQELIPGNLGSRADGSTVLSAIAQYMTNNDRNTLENKFQWTETDVRAPLTYATNFHPPTRVVKGNAFSYSGGTLATPYMSRAESSQGSSTDELTVIVSVTTAQERLNAITGHHLALLNAPTPQFALDANRCIDITEPVDCNVWHTTVIPASYDPMGIGWVNKRMTALRVGRIWRQNGRGLTEQLSIDWQPETFGQPGVTVLVPRSGAGDALDEGVNTQLPTPFDPKFPAAFAFAWNEAGTLGRTSAFNSSAPPWKSVMTGLAGLVQDVAFDYGSDFFQTGSGDLGAWCVTRDGNDIKTYYATDVRLASTVTWVLQQTVTATNAGRARVFGSKTDALLLNSFKYPLGMQHYRSVNGGTSWTGETINSNQISPNDVTANNNAEIGMAVDGVKKLVTHPDADGQYFLYAAATATGAFSVLGSSPSADRPFPMIAVDGQGNAYAATPPDLPVFDANVTFNEGGWEDYDLDGANGTPALNGGAAYLMATVVDDPTETSLKVTLNFDERRNVLSGSSVSFNWKIKWTGTPADATNNLVVETIADSHIESISFDLFDNPGLNDVWQSRTVPLDIADQTEFSVQLRMTDSTDITVLEFFIDNVHITLAETPSTPEKLYRIDDYTTSPVWIDITPDDGYTPRYPYALAVDVLAPDRLLLIGEESGIQHILGSDDNGVTWQDGGATSDDLRGVKLAGDLIAVFGVNTIKLSIDNGATFSSRLGNWASSIGSVGTIKGVLIAISEA